MNNRRFFISNLTIICFLFTLSTHAAKLEYHGYYRAGVGTNNKGGDQTCFSANGGPSNQFRLGNECSNYGEVALLMKHLEGQKKKDTNEYFETHLRLAFDQPGDTNWESANNSDKPIAVRELFFRGGKFSDSLLTYWAGKRFLREQDMYMNDWYYFADTSGNGGGLEGLNFFGGNLMLSYLKETIDTQTNIGKVGATHYDIRAKDIPITRNHFINLWMDYGTLPESNDTNGNHYGSQNGLALGILHDFKFKTGFNHLSLIYGKGVLSSLELGGKSLALKGSEDLSFRKNAYTLRLVEHLTTDLTNQIKIHFMAAYEYKRPNNTADKNTQFMNIGLSPIYFFTDHHHIAGVIGHSIYKQKNEKDQSMTRITIAPGVSLNSSIWSRPIVRIFYSKSIWSKSAKGSIGGDPYKDATSGSNFGLQGEAWF